MDCLVILECVFFVFFEVELVFWDLWFNEQRQCFVDFFFVINSVVLVCIESVFLMIEWFIDDGCLVFKIGGYFQCSDIEDFDLVWQKELSFMEVSWVQMVMLCYFLLFGVGFDVDLIYFVDGYFCVYLLIGDEVFYVIFWIDEGGGEELGFVIVVGFFGVGVKGVMVYGVLVVDLVLGCIEFVEGYLKVREILGVEYLCWDFVVFFVLNY